MPRPGKADGQRPVSRSLTSTRFIVKGNCFGPKRIDHSTQRKKRERKDLHTGKHQAKVTQAWNPLLSTGRGRGHYAVIISNSTAQDIKIQLIVFGPLGSVLHLFLPLFFLFLSFSIKNDLLYDCIALSETVSRVVLFGNSNFQNNQRGATQPPSFIEGPLFLFYGITLKQQQKIQSRAGSRWKVVREEHERKGDLLFFLSWIIFQWMEGHNAQWSVENLLSFFFCFTVVPFFFFFTSLNGGCEWAKSSE